jgi:Eukaryotic aspartyl protease
MMQLTISLLLTVSVLLPMHGDFGRTAAVASASTQNIPVSNMGYNYYAEFHVDGIPSRMVIDTGNSMFTYLARSSRPFPIAEKASNPCLYLAEDTTLIEYVVSSIHDDGSAACGSNHTMVALGVTSLDLNITVANSLYIQNDRLHQWNTSNGDVGMGYSYCFVQGNANCPLTSFQEILVASSDSSAAAFNNESSKALAAPTKFSFGLDLQSTGGSANASTLQLGGIKSEYNDSILWMPQAVSNPAYHQFFLQDLQFCGQQLLSNYSTTWPVIVDTGCVCLSLPQEVYDTFMAWFNESMAVDIPLLTMPSISFQLENSNTIYIPLASLLINSSVIIDEAGAPEVTVNNQKQRLCILRGSSIGNNQDSSYATPTIVFGTMVLHSLYFAADFETVSVGIATKFNASEVARIAQSNVNNAMCLPPATCIGDQIFDAETNSCPPPPCSSYSFMFLDATTQTCQFQTGVTVFGFLVVLTATICEVATYFLLQYSAETTLNTLPNHEGTIFARSRIDPVSKFIGSKLAIVADFIVVYGLKWAEPADRNNVRR